MKRVVVVALALAALPALAQTSTWKIDPSHAHSSFTVRHLVITNVRGEFGKTEGTLVLDEGDVTRSKVEATIDVASIDTREPKRDEHLKSADFFDVERFPHIRFVAKEIARDGAGLRLVGDFTLRGVTQLVTFSISGGQHAKDSQGRARVGYCATGRISRKAFGVSWNAVYEGGSVVVGDEVELLLDLQLIPR